LILIWIYGKLKLIILISASVSLKLNYDELWNEFEQVKIRFDAVKTKIGNTPITKIIIAEAY
jgi:hypothetical protein